MMLQSGNVYEQPGRVDMRDQARQRGPTSYEDILFGAIDSHRETKRVLLNYLNEATCTMILLPGARVF